eukprot:678931-Hanusia_phi.AAC.4
MSSGNTTRLPASQASSLTALKRVRRKKSPTSATGCLVEVLGDNDVKLLVSSRAKQSLDEDVVKYRPKSAVQSKRVSTDRQKGSQLSKISGDLPSLVSICTKVRFTTDFMQTQIPKVAQSKLICVDDPTGRSQDPGGRDSRRDSSPPTPIQGYLCAGTHSRIILCS